MKAQTFQNVLFQKLQEPAKWDDTTVQYVHMIENAQGEHAISQAMEAVIRLKLNIPQDAVVDWNQCSFKKADGSVGTFNWQTILQLVETILPLLIPASSPLLALIPAIISFLQAIGILPAPTLQAA